MDNRDRGNRQISVERMSQAGRVFLQRTAGGVAAWLKAQVILFAIGLAILMIGLALLDIPWWGLKAILIALIDMLPLIGSGLIMIPWAIIKLIAGEGQVALWLIVIYLILIIARQVLEPIIVGKSIGLKPVWTFLATVIGIIFLDPFGGISGAFAAIVIRVFLTVWQDFLGGHFDHPATGPTAGRPGPEGPRDIKDAGSDDDLKE